MKLIRTRITVTFLSLAIIITGGIVVVASMKVEAYMQERLVASMIRHAKSIALLVDPHDTTVIDRQAALSNFAAAQEIRITLIAVDGRVLFDSDVASGKLALMDNHLHRPEIVQAAREGIGTNIRLSATVGREFLYIAYRVSPSMSDIRFIRCSMPLEALTELKQGIWMNVAMVGIVVMALVVIVSVLISRRIAQPMHTIAAAVEKIRQGDLDVRLDVKGSAEVAGIARAINEMTAKLRKDIVEFQKLARARSEFIGNVSHELRTPIFSLQGFLETLLRGAIDDPKVNREFVGKAQEHALRLNVLLEDLINISQIESGEMRMSFRYFSLQELLRLAVHDQLPLAQQREITLRVESFDERIEVYGDKERLRQVLNNLIDNAIKYNHAHGEVIVRVVDGGDDVSICVRDSGVGISGDQQARIFERFYRIDKNRSRELGGTGLGLAIVKHILEAHGTTIEVTSAPGNGSEFRFALKKYQS